MNAFVASNNYTSTLKTIAVQNGVPVLASVKVTYIYQSPYSLGPLTSTSVPTSQPTTFTPTAYPTDQPVTSQVAIKKNKKSITVGAIAGIVIGSVVGIALIVCLAYYFARARNQKVYTSVIVTKPNRDVAYDPFTQPPASKVPGRDVNPLL